ncbi:type VI secretion system accessory protein TagJ [Acidiphilium sp.]|uniref:type VI secretion system accessory protein TagJ n=1 Tax=Acidiphilium sp. TaxID=527 RepID=UPI00258CC445|nr:type VI secretion system accessory protein TagJ [Acidiphilium sp.]
MPSDQTATPINATSPAAGSAGAAFRAGQLDAAVAAATAAVKAKPTDVAARILLVEMLVFAGNFERADVLLDAAGQLDPAAALVVAEFRQLLRGEMARRQLYRDGRVPEFLGEPGPVEQSLLASLVAQRAGDLQAAREAAAAAEAARTARPGTADGAAFTDFRDASDTTAGILEVLTTTGKYFWVPISRVTEITFHKPARPRDLIWRRASLAVEAGPDGDVYIPAIYAVTGEPPADEYRLGRATNWQDHAGLVTGIGQREFLVGDDAVPIMDLGTLVFAA